jgi:hypothetical protein
MLRAGAGRSEHGKHVAHGLLRLGFESFEQIAPASVPFWPPTYSVGPAGRIMPWANAGL